MNQIVVKELNKKDQMLAAFDLIGQIYDKMTLADFEKNLDEMILRDDYKMVAAFLGEKMIGVSGYSISLMLYCGRYLQASNLVVDLDFRKKGVGKILLNSLEQIAKKHDCQKFVLDSYTENKQSHPLYFREGFYIRGFHFMKEVG